MNITRIAIMLALSIMLISGIACGGGAEPSPTPTSTPTTHEWTLTQLTFSGGQAAFPSISADGTKIAFMSMVDDDASEIFIVNSDGSGLTQLTFSGGRAFYPSISADGTKIAFINGDFGVSIVNFDGTDVTQLTSYLSAETLTPSISGDGTKIAFESIADKGQQIFLLELIP